MPSTNTLQLKRPADGVREASTAEPADWIAVACADHVRRGVALGIMQVCHGKERPLRQIAPGSRVAYYSPSETFGGRDRLQSFTAFGIVRQGDVYRVDLGGGFRPYRRDVGYMTSRATPVAGLLARRGFALCGPNWGQKLRYGLLRVDAASMDAIAEAMGIPGIRKSDIRSLVEF